MQNQIYIQGHQDLKPAPAFQITGSPTKSAKSMPTIQLFSKSGVSKPSDAPIQPYIQNVFKDSPKRETSKKSRPLSRASTYRQNISVLVETPS